MEKKKIKVPDSWKEVTVGQYQELTEAKKDVDIISILLDEDPEDIKKWDGVSMGKVLSHLEWTKKLPDNHYNRVIEIEGTKYNLVENLNGFSGGEWFDMEEYLSDFNGNLHLILAMLYRDNKEYDAEKVKDRAELFRDKLMIGDVNGCFVFFSHVARLSTITIQDCLIRQSLTRMKQQRKEGRGSKKKRLQRSGTGTGSFTTSHREM